MFFKKKCNFVGNIDNNQHKINMKRFTMIVALILIAVMPTFAERVPSETAQKVATTFLNNNGAKAAQLTDLSKEAGFTNLYIFNGNPGFVVMAADDCVQPILGYSLTGKFIAENMPTNISGWLQGYNDEIQYAIDNKLKASAETIQLWKDLTEGNAKAAKATIVVDALIQTTWDQDPGYNNLCPYDNNANELTVTGCVATAMAQIMRYWEYPSHGVGSHSYTPSTHPEYGTQSVNFAQQTYNWADMPLYSPNAEIAKLMYHCGVAVDMDYDIGSTGGSGAFNTAIAPALTNYFNYKSTASLKNKSSYTTNNWNNLLKTELDAGRPVQYGGSGSGGGHAFVCDGYDSSNNYHFNWGWSGNNDGFYSLTNLNPGSGGSGGGSYNFTQNQSAIIGIQPKDCTTTSPTNFSVTKDGRNAILSWTTVSNASAYSIYRDGNIIANTTSTTYTDSNLAYGTYTYYVKSVDSNGAKSSPTSTITVAIEPIPSQLTVTKQNNNAVLSWTEPEWSAPQTDDEVLTYSYGNTIYSFGSGGTMQLYYGHKYPAAMIDANKVLYKVSFYPTMTGSFRLCVYTANAGNSKPQTQVYTQDITVSVTGWNDIVLNTPLQLDASKDLWVFIHDPEGKNYPMGAGSYEGTDSNGNYVSTSTPTSSVSVQEVVMLINTYITDGAFSYNLYDGTTTVASNISSSTYTVNNIANNTAHRYTLKTNFNGGLTEASNMVGLTLGDASLASLTMAANDKMTVTEGSKLTVNGTLSDVNADNLILENGAQLVNNSTGVKATVKKNITAYSQDGGWNLIASPMTESLTASNIAGLLTNNFDLYTFDQSEQLEWRNYEAQSFTINNKTGYLYANSGNPTLSFEGTLAASTSATPLVYDANVYFKGFNLIGNPYPCNTYVDRSFYVLDEDGANFTLGSNPIPPCGAILVQAQDTGESVTFSKTASKNSPNIAISVAEVNKRGSALVDQAKVSFDENDQLRKYTLNEQGGKLYIPQNGEDFAVASANGENEMPVNFKAAKNGKYTISIETESIALDYLHLIDNMTGSDINLLATPSYTFEAKTTDYASRFRLVFDVNAMDGPSTGSGTEGSEAFAYISDGNIIITNGTSTPSTNSGTEGSGACATLQIVDMMGRVVIEGDAINLVSTSGMTSGVYILCLIDGEKVRTQKIVIE